MTSYLVPTMTCDECGIAFQPALVHDMDDLMIQARNNGWVCTHAEDLCFDCKPKTLHEVIRHTVAEIDLEDVSLDTIATFIEAAVVGHLGLESTDD